ncbi:MAG TPA: helix-turn-helix transcriptional regulator [Caulobacteraceae bacterium]|nr:helix-turn-helix transcriptional regulator [Caulobacteraceae bacterium]
MAIRNAPRHFIRAWRKYRGLTQAQLAERIGIDRSYLSNIETGRRRYDQPFLEAAAEALRCEPADLIMRDPTEPEGLWSIWDQLAPVERRQLVDIAKALKRTGTDD